MGLVQDLFVGVGGASPQQLTNVNGSLFFTATTAETGLELWKTNGTAASTSLVKDIRPGGSSNPTELTNVNGTLFFSAANEAENYELWKSDGTAAGTVLVKEILGGPGGSTPLFLTNVNGTLYFYARDSITGQEP
jgi:ELWxxDGT repeat protein